MDKSDFKKIIAKWQTAVKIDTQSNYDYFLVSIFFKTIASLKLFDVTLLCEDSFFLSTFHQWYLTKLKSSWIYAHCRTFFSNTEIFITSSFKSCYHSYINHIPDKGFEMNIWHNFEWLSLKHQRCASSRNWPFIILLWRQKLWWMF